jgi:hypothetical protein
MAGVIAHLVIAGEIMKKLPEGRISRPDLFYLGALAPDAVHAREGYVRAHKKHSHFRDDIPDKDFETPINYEIYHNRLVDFIKKYNNPEDSLVDYYRGYVTHILTDELFVLTVRKEFCENMKKLGISQSDRPFFDYIVGDMNRNDILLAYRYEGMEEIRTYMEHVPAYPVDDYISKQEMDDCRNWFLRHHFYEQQEELEPAFISYQRTLDFIHTAAEEIIQRLSGNGDLPVML